MPLALASCIVLSLSYFTQANHYYYYHHVIIIIYNILDHRRHFLAANDGLQRRLGDVPVHGVALEDEEVVSGKHDALVHLREVFLQDSQSKATTRETMNK